MRQTLHRRPAEFRQGRIPRLIQPRAGVGVESLDTVVQYATGMRLEVRLEDNRATLITLMKSIAVLVVGVHHASPRRVRSTCTARE